MGKSLRGILGFWGLMGSRLMILFSTKKEKTTICNILRPILCNIYTEGGRPCGLCCPCLKHARLRLLFNLIWSMPDWAVVKLIPPYFLRYTHMSWGRVESSVFEYKYNEPPLSTLRNFKDAKSVYSFVTAKMSTQTPAWTATAACKICQCLRFQKNPQHTVTKIRKIKLPDLCRMVSAQEAMHGPHPLPY